MVGRLTYTLYYGRFEDFSRRSKMPRRSEPGSRRASTSVLRSANIATRSSSPAKSRSRGQAATPSTCGRTNALASRSTGAAFYTCRSRARSTRASASNSRRVGTSCGVDFVQQGRTAFLDVEWEGAGLERSSLSKATLRSSPKPEPKEAEFRLEEPRIQRGARHFVSKGLQRLPRGAAPLAALGQKPSRTWTRAPAASATTRRLASATSCLSASEQHSARRSAPVRTKSLRSRPR